MKTHLSIMLGALAALTGVAVARPRVELPRTQTIVEEIRPLEGARDPTCHATASRLEDLSYGTVAHREQTDEIASHLRAALTLGATDQATSSVALHDLDHAAPVRTASWPTATSARRSARSAGRGSRPSSRSRSGSIRAGTSTGPVRCGATSRRPGSTASGATVDVAYPPAREITLRFAGGPVSVCSPNDRPVPLTRTIRRVPHPRPRRGADTVCSAPQGG
jgi:hypothetical protein